jgi:hypothetical protein
MSIADEMGIEWQEVESAEEILDLDWQRDDHGYFWLRVRGNGHETVLYMTGRPNYCDRGHWQVICDYYHGSTPGIDTIDHADFFPRLYMSLDVAKSEIQKFVAWRMFQESDGLNELVEENRRKAIGLEASYAEKV